MLGKVASSADFVMTSRLKILFPAYLLSRAQKQGLCQAVNAVAVFSPETPAALACWHSRGTPRAVMGLK